MTKPISQNLVIDVKPSMSSVELTTAIFQTSTTLYSDTIVTYSSSTATYGGADILSDKSPLLDTVRDTKPSIGFVVDF